MRLFWVDSFVSINTGKPEIKIIEISADEVTDYPTPGIVTEYEFWGNPAYKVVIFSSDEDHAKKAALDLIAEYKAKKAGVTV